MWEDKSHWRSSREGFGEAIVELGKRHEDVVVLTCDLTESTRAKNFQKSFPERFFQFGIAEQNMMCAAAGMSLVGLTPFVCTYGVFSAGRCWEQLRLSVCYSNCNVKIQGGHAGLLVGPDGASHQATEDLAMMRVLPNMTVLCPCDSVEAKKATIAAYEMDGPVYIRLHREPTPIITEKSTPYRIGEVVAFGGRGDAVIAACGGEVFQALLAQEQLKQEGIQALVLNVHTIKPLDPIIAAEAEKCGLIVAVEDHQAAGGLGGAVAELVAEYFAARVIRMGLYNRFGESGQPIELINHFQLSVKAITDTVRANL